MIDLELEPQVVAIKRETGKVSYYMRQNGQWKWVRSDEIRDRRSLVMDFEHGVEDLDVSHSLSFDRLLVKKRTTNKNRTTYTVDHIYCNEDDKLYMMDPNAYSLKMSQLSAKKMAKPAIVAIEKCIKRPLAVEWIVRLENGETKTVTHPELRSLNLPLFLEYAKNHIKSSL